MIKIFHKTTGRILYQQNTDTLEGANLHGLDLSGAYLAAAKLNGADLSETNLSDANLTECDLSGANLDLAYLHSANLSGSTLTNTVFTDAILTEASLANTNLTRTDLTDADLTGVDLSNADIKSGDLTRTKLNGALLNGTYLTYATLMHTILQDANLAGATLYGTQLTEVVLKDANLSGTHLFNTIFMRCADIHEAKGLVKVRHAGPSSLDAATLRTCVEHLPEVFMSGVGYTDAEVQTFRALYINSPIQFYSCFISYSHKDEEFAHRLFSRLKEANIRVWYAPEDMKGGQKLHEQINQAIRIHDRLLLVLSDSSLSSEWVMTEIRNAREAEKKENRRKLFPIRLCSFDRIQEWECFDATTGKDLGVEVREYYVPDFSHWKEHDSFEASFAKLLRDMKAAEQLA